jgi:hypothetical protein
MILPRRPDARSPGPRGPDAFSPTGGSCLRAALAAAEHTAKLPADLLADSLRPVGGGQSSRLGGIGGGTQGVRAHMRDASGLPGRAGSGHHRRSADLTSSGMSDETAAGLSDAKLATRRTHTQILPRVRRSDLHAARVAGALPGNAEMFVAA